jgi:hypothetical protein
MVFLWGGMNTEIKKLLFILTEKIGVDIIMLYENQVEVNQYLFDTLQDRIYGMVMESVLLIHMGIW